MLFDQSSDSVTKKKLVKDKTIHCQSFKSAVYRKYNGTKHITRRVVGEELDRKNSDRKLDSMLLCKVWKVFSIQGV